MKNPSRKNASGTRGRPFQRGNPGRPRGARNRSTQAVEALLAGEAEALTRTAIELALGRDATALKMCLDRIAPVRRDVPIIIDLPGMKGVKDAASLLAAGGEVLEALGAGELSPGEAGALMGLLERQRRLVETASLEQRIEALEEQQR